MGDVRITQGVALAHRYDLHEKGEICIACEVEKLQVELTTERQRANTWMNRVHESDCEASQLAESLATALAQLDIQRARAERNELMWLLTEKAYERMDGWVAELQSEIERPLIGRILPRFTRPADIEKWAREMAEESVAFGNAYDSLCKQISPMFCNHANEAPLAICTCPDNCPCWELMHKKRLDVADSRYSELIDAVGKKYVGETRHETALRYIRQAELSEDAKEAKSETGRS